MSEQGNDYGQSLSFHAYKNNTVLYDSGRSVSILSLHPMDNKCLVSPLELLCCDFSAAFFVACSAFRWLTCPLKNISFLYPQKLLGCSQIVFIVIIYLYCEVLSYQLCSISLSRSIHFKMCPVMLAWAVPFLFHTLHFIINHSDTLLCFTYLIFLSSAQVWMIPLCK